MAQITYPITWNTFYDDMNLLTEKIVNYKPDLLVPVLDGGTVPAHYIAKAIKAYAIASIGIERIGDVRTLYKDILFDISGLDLLIIEDSLKTGLGPLMAKEKFEKRGAKVKIASLYITPDCAPFVDYYGKIMDVLPDLPWKNTVDRDKQGQ